MEAATSSKILVSYRYYMTSLVEDLDLNCKFMCAENAVCNFSQFSEQKTYWNKSSAFRGFFTDPLSRLVEPKHQDTKAKATEEELTYDRPKSR